MPGGAGEHVGEQNGRVESLRGQLLIASPALLDPNFLRSVILVVEHSDEGAMGLVLNRPTEAVVGETVPPLAALDADPFVHVGGPVQAGTVIVLARFDDPADAALLVFGDVGFFAPDADSAAMRSAAQRIRVFAGYAGWGAGQLEAELDEESWIVEAARAEDVFCETPEALWSNVLRRKGGQYALVARMPVDPSVN